LTCRGQSEERSQAIDVAQRAPLTHGAPRCCGYAAYSFAGIRQTRARRATLPAVIGVDGHAPTAAPVCERPLWAVVEGKSRGRGRRPRRARLRRRAAHHRAWRAALSRMFRFVARLLDGEKMAPPCEEFGISRKTGYKIYARYKDCGLQGLTDRSQPAPAGPAEEGIPHLGRAQDPGRRCTTVGKARHRPVHNWPSRLAANSCLSSPISTRPCGWPCL
jgi:hypothetical protein